MHVITSLFSFTQDDSLNLDTLLIQVRGGVTQWWYQLGEALEVSKDVLDKCTNYPPEESIVEILDQWLRNFPGHPTWRDVANALRKIGFQQLANDIEMVYETGNNIILDPSCNKYCYLIGQEQVYISHIKAYINFSYTEHVKNCCL